MVTYTLRVEYVDGDHDYYGPFAENDKAMEFGGLLADEDEDIAAYHSLSVKSPSSHFGGHAVC